MRKAYRKMALGVAFTLACGLCVNYARSLQPRTVTIDDKTPVIPGKGNGMKTLTIAYDGSCYGRGNTVHSKGGYAGGEEIVKTDEGSEYSTWNWRDGVTKIRRGADGTIIAVIGKNPNIANAAKRRSEELLAACKPH